MKETDIAYMAGIVDGEGCISVSRYKNRKYIFGFLRIVNTDKRLIDWLHQTFGGHVRKRKRYRPQVKISWEWGVAAHKARGLLRELIPHLKIKKEQAQTILELQRAGDRNRGVDGTFKRTQTEEMRKHNETVYERIHFLNRRGAP